MGLVFDFKKYLHERMNIKAEKNISILIEK